MPDRNEKVFERVRQELAKTPKMGSRELYEIAQSVDKAIGQDTLQQFHARYVLPIRREESAARGGGRKSKRGRKPSSRKAAKNAKASAATASAAATKASTRRRGSAKSAPASERDRVRGVLLEFARDFADAESRAEIVQVLSRVDDYVERIAPSAA